jgi:hypothetical protein
LLRVEILPEHRLEAIDGEGEFGEGGGGFVTVVFLAQFAGAEAALRFLVAQAQCLMFGLISNAPKVPPNEFGLSASGGDQSRGFTEGTFLGRHRLEQTTLELPALAWAIGINPAAAIPTQGRARLSEVRPGQDLQTGGFQGRDGVRGREPDLGEQGAVAA